MEEEQKIRKILKKGGEALEETISAGVRTEEKLRTVANQGLEKLEEGVTRVAKPLMEAEGAVRRTFQAASKFKDLLSLEKAIVELRSRISEVPNGFKIMQQYKALAEKMRAAKATVEKIIPQNKKQAKQKKKITRTLKKTDTSFTQRLRNFFTPALSTTEICSLSAFRCFLACSTE